MENKEKNVRRDDAQITGRTEGPYGSDGTDVERPTQDNKHNDIVEGSANGLDSAQVRGGQDGRNNRGIGSIDMDSSNGLLRFNDGDSEPASDVTEEGLDQAAKSATSPVNVTTHGPDDYASDGDVPTPKAQEEAKEDAGNDETSGVDTSGDGGDANQAASQEAEDQEIAQTGTSTTHQPTY